ncbi:MAG TPA: hypothetical protein VMU33_18610 [Burkholderiaceae bacterium]|nr:hypothetical protein [Burkholderiaceae bacterium]
MLIELASAGAAAQSADLNLDPNAGRASGECGSVVVVRCELTSRVAAPADSFSDTVHRAQQTLEQRRSHPPADGTTELGTVVITADHVENPRDKRWQAFGTSVANAQIPDCFSLGEAGLLAIPLMPILALAGKCH